MSKNDLYYNGSGYADPTAYKALKSMTREDDELARKVRKLVDAIHDISHLAGFEVVGKVHLKHKRTGKEFKGDAL